MADFHTLIKRAKPDWPEEWCFRLAEVCNILRQIEARNSEHNVDVAQCAADTPARGSI
jgi:hypothetical protein